MSPLSSPGDCDLRDSMFESVEDSVSLSGGRIGHAASGSRQQVIRDYRRKILDIATHGHLFPELHTQHVCTTVNTVSFKFPISRYVDEVDLFVCPLHAGPGSKTN